MYIGSSTIGMESARRYTSSTTRTSRFVVKDYRGGSTHSAQETAATSAKGMEIKDRVESMRGNRMQLRTGTSDTLFRFRQTTIRYIFSMLFGESRAKEIFGEDISRTSVSTGTEDSNVLTISSGQYYEEAEETSFAAKGTVRTADGREISINLDVSMSRSFTQYFEEELSVMKVNTCDPLVINFEGNAADLTDQKFLFDIDGDGDMEEISNLACGSGYLALDKNGDGIINDGKELFGPNSGNGFADLAAYDQDGNGWIDEADPIWSKLKIWCRNEDGTDSMYTLSDKGVGAICLQNTSTDFSVKGVDNQTNGIIRSTGIFFYENGNAGTVQHLDVAQ